MPSTATAREQAAASTQAFVDAWESFIRTTRRAQGRANQARTPGLSIAQFYLVEELADHQPRTVGELALAAGIAQPTATRMLAGLARDGFVTRRGSDHDRRVVLVELTNRGRDALNDKLHEVQDARRRLSDSLNPQERHDAAVLLDRLSEIIEAL
jgi:DNA-binding MarR family transcriptional regulator